MSEDKKLIGWWLKHLDALIEESFIRLLAAEGIGRRHWQLLNMLGDGGGDLAAIRAQLAPFWSTADDVRDAEIAALLDELARRGWLRVEDGAVDLTPDGAAARSRIAEAVAEHRRQSTAGIDAEEFGRMLDTLRRMAGNLARLG